MNLFGFEDDVTALKELVARHDAIDFETVRNGFHRVTFLTVGFLLPFSSLKQVLSYNNERRRYEICLKDIIKFDNSEMSLISRLGLQAHFISYS